MPDWLEVQDRRGRNVLINLGNVLKIEGDGKLTASINFIDGSMLSCGLDYQALAHCLTAKTTESEKR